MQRLMPLVAEIAASFLFAISNSAFAQATWVHLDSNNNLVYHVDSMGNRIPDFSYAGYGEGGVPLPSNVAVQQTLSPSGGDDTANIQNAIIAVEALSPDGNGIRGAVLLNPGTFQLGGTLAITNGGVVLEGSGTNQTTLLFTGNSRLCISVSGSGGRSEVGATVHITDNYVPLNATSFDVDNPGEFAVGDSIVVNRAVTQPWIDAIGMTNYWKPNGGISFERTVTAINGNRISIDIPLCNPIEMQYVTGAVYRYTFTGRISQVGLRNFQISSSFDDIAAHIGAGRAIQFDKCQNCWASDLILNHFYNGFNLGGNSKWITVQDTEYVHNTGTNAGPDAFAASGEMALFLHCSCTPDCTLYHVGGTQAATPGPNVFLDMYALGKAYDCEAHQRWACGCLYDRTTVASTDGSSTGIKYQNRGGAGSGQGYAAGFSVMWNCDSVGSINEIPQVPYHYNWAIGRGSSSATWRHYGDDGIFDATNMTVAPSSLYLRQLNDRLGPAAVENIGYAAFGISASPGSQSVNAGNNAVFTVTVSDDLNLNNTVSLSASGLPSGATATFSPASLTGAGTSTLTVSTAASTPSGACTLTITGTSGNVSHTSSVALTVNGSGGGLPAGWTDADIGSVGLAGSASYNSGAFTVSGSGADIWNTSDAFNYAWQSVSGDQTIIARVASENGTASYAKAGVMIRESTAPDAVEASVLITPTNGVAMQIRPATGSSSANLTGWIRNVLPPQWLKLVRSGNTFTGYYSADGSTWTQIASTNITMAANALAGLAVASHDTTSLNAATFDNVSISASAPPPDFSLSASPGSLTIIQGANGISTISIVPVNGYSGTVSLSASGLPSGVTASFNPSSTTTSSMLTLSASSTAATGSATVTITGTDGTLTHTTTISLTVNPAPDFSITATPSSQTITAGNGASYTTTIGSLNGFSGAVSLSVSGLPANASASFNPASISGSGNSTLTVNTTTSTPAGTYTLTITGTDGTLTHSTTVSLKVNAAPQPDFSLSASPTSLTIVQGNNGTSTITINPVNGYNNTVSLSASGLPSGVTASFNPGSTTSSSTLTLTASSTAATGTATVTITGTDGTLTHTTTISLTVNPASGLPAGWTDTDIGSVGLAGSASYSGGTFTVNGSGADIWSTSDAFNYAWQSVSGDQTIIARVASQQNTSSWAKSGAMFRDSTAANGAYVAVYVTPANGVSMQIRPSDGAGAIDVARQTGLTVPYWVKIVRSGNTFTGYSSPDGSTWTEVAATNVTMASAVDAGLAVCAHNNTVLNTSTFDNVSITGPAPDFSLSASPTSLTIVQGNNGISTITINPVNGYSGTVSLSASGLPSGVTASFNPSSTTSSSTLTLTASSTAATGSATVTITGTDGTLTHTTTISLTVNATVNFAGIYQIQNEASGLVLNNQGSLTNGSPITQWTSVASSNLDWQFFPTSNGYYQINSCKSALDAVVQGASTAAGAGIIQWSFGSSGDDQWQPQLNGDGSYTFVNLHSGLVLGDPGSSTSTSTQMDQETANGGSNQKWVLLKQ
ncbi:MAG: RICIN domain-containing protein [Verrucomicrobiota bacterium]|nr:RICIN domain-containing protein [Verrucomicrobiota bacterium]